MNERVVAGGVAACCLAGFVFGCGSSSPTGDTSDDSGGSVSGGAHSGGNVASGGTTSGAGGASTGGASTGGASTGGASTGGAGGMGGSGGSAAAGTSGFGGAGAGGRNAAGSGGAGGAGSGGAAGSGAVTYHGCHYIGGVDRITVRKRDPGRNLCLVLELQSPTTNASELTLPPSWGLSRAIAFWPATTECAGFGTDPSRASSTAQSGSVSMAGSGATQTVTFDVVMTFPASAGNVMETEVLEGTVGASATCR
ncbi:MAG TPA: hypothetical protein VFZ53_30750 [Polyangiaceae bacterium]